ncbi:MAG: FAD binding domain-containing protein, partial [Candidatus Kryptoniota bacterium]
MITEYYRPQTLAEAREIIQKKGKSLKILGGGTTLWQWKDQVSTVLDVQAIGLKKIEPSQTHLVFGAGLTLAELENASAIPAALKTAIQLNSTYNQRQIATVAGSLVAADGRSTFATAMLALNAHLKLFPSDDERAYGDLLALPSETLDGQLITEIRIPANVQLAFKYVARTKADLPLVCVAL